MTSGLPPSHRLQAQHVIEVDDPYRYGRVLTDYDLHLFGEGTHLRIFEKLGAHRIRLGATVGVHFAVWAPNADRVSVVGDFNGWDGRVHAMRLLHPGWCLGTVHSRSAGRGEVQVRDPHGNGCVAEESRSVRVCVRGPASDRVRSCATSRGYEWHDQAWMTTRPQSRRWLERRMSMYEVHLGSWARVPEDGNRFLTYRELAYRLVPYVKDLGFTHIELLPVMEHPFSGSWGYQVLGFFAPTSRFGPPEDFKSFVDACHQAGLGVILDWVPGHFPKDEHGLAHFDGTALYEHADPRQGEHQDWGTLIFNYGRNEVRNFLLSNALFWLEEYHVDGLRVDAVASMLYLDYSRQRKASGFPTGTAAARISMRSASCRQLNVLTHGRHPGTITAAEESTAWPGVSRPVHLGGLGFTYKWNMGWMHDMLEYAHEGSGAPALGAQPDHVLDAVRLHRELHPAVLARRSRARQGLDARQDARRCVAEVRGLRTFYGFMYAHPGKKLLFMGYEFGQWREWNHDRSLDWHLLDDPPHAALRRLHPGL